MFPITTQNNDIWTDTLLRLTDLLLGLLRPPQMEGFYRRTDSDIVQTFPSDRDTFFYAQRFFLGTTCTLRRGVGINARFPSLVA